MSDTPQTNGYDRERASQVIEAIEAKREEIRRLKKKAADSIAKDVASLSADIGIQFKQAKKAWGLSTPTLKAQLKLRDLQRKQNEVVEGLDEDTQEDLEQLRRDLGQLADLPMGQWFLEGKGEPDAKAVGEAQAKPKPTRRQAKQAALNAELDGLAAGGEGVAADNVTRLEAGIKPLRGSGSKTTH